jgi:hypothetical protein
MLLHVTDPIADRRSASRIHGPAGVRRLTLQVSDRVEIRKLFGNATTLLRP